jgi:hypothetical protein
MRTIIYVFAVVLVIAWLVGWFGFQARGLIHLLLIIAFVMVALNLLQTKRTG